MCHKENVVIINSVEYKKIKEIGQGAYGKVYKLEKNNKYYALKKIPTTDLNKEEIEKYRQEAINLSSFNNENIVKYYDSSTEDGHFNILMEYAGKYNLSNLIQNYKKEKKNIDEYIIKKIILQICSGLKVIHKAKLIHRDLKPQNIFIDENIENKKILK